MAMLQLFKRLFNHPKNSWPVHNIAGHEVWELSTSERQTLYSVLDEYKNDELITYSWLISVSCKTLRKNKPDQIAKSLAPSVIREIATKILEVSGLTQSAQEEIKKK